MSIGGTGRRQGHIKLVETWGGGQGVVPQGDLGQELPAGFLSSQKWEGLRLGRPGENLQVRSWGGSALSPHHAWLSCPEPTAHLSVLPMMQLCLPASLSALSLKVL